MNSPIKKESIVLKNGYLFLLSFLLFNVGFYSTHNIQGLNVYYISYYAKSNPDKGITISPVYFTSAIYNFISSLTIPFSGLFEAKIGLRLSLIIAVLFGVFNALMLKFFTLVPLYLLACGINGLSDGISSVFLKFLCMFFPGNEGFITAFTKPFSAAFIFGWYYFGEYFVNENAVQLPEGVDFYELDIAKNVTKLSNIILVAILSSLGLFLISTLNINFSNVKEESKLISQKNKTQEELLKEEMLKKKESKEIYMKNIKKIFTSSIYWKFFFLTVLLAFEPTLFATSYRVLSDSHGIDLRIVKTNMTISGVLGAFFCLLAGWINDKYGLKVIMIPVGFIFGISGLFYILTLHYSSDLFFCFTVYLSNVFATIITAILFPNLVKIFGLKYVMEIYGPLGLMITLISFFCSGILTLFNSLFGTDYDLPYFILIGIGALMAVMSVLISWNINTEPFDYYSESEETTTKEDDNVIVTLVQKETIIEIR